MSARKTGTKARRRLASAGTYLVLSLFAVIVLFPFIVALSTSLKEPADVFNYPPTLVPRTAATTTVEGIEGPVPLFEIDVAGESRELALVEDGVAIGVYTLVADEGAEDAQFQLDDALVTGTGREVTILVNGRERDREVGTAEIDGETVEVVRVRGTTAGLFADPDDLDTNVVANVNEATPVQERSLRTENFSDVLELQRLDRALTNTVLVTLLVVGGQVLTSIIGGYAFARLHFAGRDRLFLMYLGSIMIPFVVLIVPLHQLVVSIGWIDRLVSLIVPFVFTAYGTFLMRQFFITIPPELEEAARIDGASRWTILWRIMVPLSMPAIAALSAFAFLYAWNSFVWPLVAINSGNLDNRVLSLALQVLGGRAADSPNLILAGVMIAVIPPITAFLLAQRHFVEGTASQGLKG
jgi:multiple sugar transport system permease protein